MGDSVRNPLSLLRHIREDDTLSATQKHVLMCAVLRMNNATGRVKASHQMLADDASVSTKTVGRVMGDRNVARYFATSAGARGNSNYDFHRAPLPYVAALDSGAAESMPDWERELRRRQAEANARAASNRSPEPAGPRVQSGGHGVHATGLIVPPSTSSSTSSSTYEFRLTAEEEMAFEAIVRDI